MPRASWRGLLRVSLVSCPIYLSPATSRTKPIRLHQVWRPASLDEPEDGLPDRGREEQLDERLPCVMAPAKKRIRPRARHASHFGRMTPANRGRGAQGDRRGND